MLSKQEQKFIKSLKVKKYRIDTNCFLVEGKKNVQEVLKSNFEVELLIGTSDFFKTDYLPVASIRTEEVKRDLLSQLGTFKTNESVIAIVKIKRWNLDIHKVKDHLFVLDGVGDPGNMGTIIRTLDWFGFNQFVYSCNCADIYNPKTINSSMGSFTRVKFFEIDLEYFYKENKLPIFGTSMEGKSIFKQHFSLPSVIVIGSESTGISKLSREKITNYISIPKFGKAESLNVGIASGIIASHLRIS